MTATSSPSQIFITQSNLSPILRSHCLTKDIGTVVLSDDLLLEFKDNVVSSPISLLVGIHVYIHAYYVYLLVYYMSNYVKTCSFCKNEIKMSDESGKWLPYNKDGSTHDCKKKNGKQEITLEAVLRRLEIHGIIINIERLMNEK
jgi:hypothetical protein